MPTHNERITHFLQELYQGKRYLVIEEDSYGIQDILEEVTQAGLVEVVGSFYELTVNGRFLIKDGKTYDDFERERKAPPLPTTHIGHNITGSFINQSNLDIDTSHFKRLNASSAREKQNPPIKDKTEQDTATNPQLSLWLNTMSTIISAAAAAITLYLTFFKKS